VDCFDAMTSTRPYRQALLKEQVIDMIKEETTRELWDPEISAAFFELIWENSLEERGYKGTEAL